MEVMNKISYKCMRHVERQMQEILEELAGYLKQQVIGEHVWRDISALEKDLEEFVEQAVEYQNNTFHSHPSYYIYYFEMRLKQCGVLQSLQCGDAENSKSSQTSRHYI